MQYTLKELRTATGMTQKQFGEYFGIPHRTIQNWEGGQRECPRYLLELMIYKLENEKIDLNSFIEREVWEAAQAKIKERKSSEQQPITRYRKQRGGVVMIAKIGDSANEITPSEQPVPKGYKWQDGSLVTDEAQAEKVRAVFEKWVGKKGKKENNEPLE